MADALYNEDQGEPIEEQYQRLALLRNQLARELADVKDELDTARTRIGELADDLGDRTAERDHLSAWAEWLWAHATPAQRGAARGALGRLPEYLDGTLFEAMAEPLEGRPS